jgi:GTP-binding protein
MASDNFVDYVKIHVKSGNGGGGSTHYRREKYIPKGGPDGGDGGRGGHVYLRGNKQLWTLLHLKFKKHVKAEHGAHGSSNLKTGSQGKDVYIDVPLGTIVRDEESDEILFEITEDGEEKIVQKRWSRWPWE